MFPDSVAAVVGFLIVIAPGLVFEAVRDHRRPSAERSAFREISEIALASLAFGGAALAVLWGVRAVAHGLLPDPQAWARKGSDYVPDHLQQVVTFFSAWVILAALGAFVAASRIFRTTAKLNPHTTGWFEAFRLRVPTDTYPVALVRMDDRSEYVGEVVYYETSPVTAEREIMLGPPLWYREDPKDELIRPPVEDAWRYVVLPGARVADVWVRYPPRAEQPPTPEKRWLRRVAGRVLGWS